ncbi:acyl-CoA dehydrogenase family protein [Nonomuraea candida]|uniref:acyl-CoA dehydrogenase family protein n=1 Tax=Nonomuraea candida TaxID=359159 RepID=UPI000694C19F|nr:acyl-CoA dehydrogenase family protein [Nonomuraea candida]
MSVTGFGGEGHGPGRGVMDRERLPAGVTGFDDGDAYRLAVRAGLAGDAYATVERRLTAGLLAVHGVPLDAQSTALLPADTAANAANADAADTAASAHDAAPDADPAGDNAGGKGRCWDFVVGAGAASWFLAPGPALVLFERAEVSCHRRRSLLREEHHVVDATGAAGRVLCDRPGCACCGLATARARCGTAGYLWGIARASVDAAVDRVKHRRQFGRAIGDNQAVAFRLAALAARLEAFARLGEAVAGRLPDTAEPLRHASELLAACADLALEASAESLHLHGADGLLVSERPEDLHRRALAFAVRHGSPSRLRIEPQADGPAYGRGESR